MNHVVISLCVQTLFTSCVPVALTAVLTGFSLSLWMCDFLWCVSTFLFLATCCFNLLFSSLIHVCPVRVQFQSHCYSTNEQIFSNQIKFSQHTFGGGLAPSCSHLITALFPSFHYPPTPRCLADDCLLGLICTNKSFLTFLHLCLFLFFLSSALPRPF